MAREACCWKLGGPRPTSCSTRFRASSPKKGTAFPDFEAEGLGFHVVLKSGAVQFTHGELRAVMQMAVALHVMLCWQNLHALSCSPCSGQQQDGICMSGECIPAWTGCGNGLKEAQQACKLRIGSSLPAWYSERQLLAVEASRAPNLRSLRLRLPRIAQSLETNLSATF